MVDADGWWEPVRAYCERGGPAFWAEPLNAVSNAGFLLAGVAGLRRAVSGTDADRAVFALAALIIVVGAGSFLFHTVAVRWALLADVVPIAVFIYAYFFLAMRRYLGLGPLAAVTATIGFAAAALGLPGALAPILGPAALAATNGSADYLPALLALFGVAALLAAGVGPRSARVRREAAASLARSGGIFLVSLVARTVDLAVCGTLPTGTHAIWHLLNAWMLWRLVALAGRVGAAPKAGAA